MEVILIDNQDDFDLNIDEIKTVCDCLFKKLEKEARSELNIVFIGREEIKELNKKYRGIESITDVLSFSYIDDKKIFGFVEDPDKFKDEFGFITVGEIFICPFVAEENIKTYEKDWSLTKEIIFLIIHGMLHIYGYDHKKHDDRLLMEKKQESLLSEIEEKFKI